MNLILQLIRWLIAFFSHPADAKDLDKADEVANECEVCTHFVTITVPPPQRYLWLLDNGHGALTRGRCSPPFEDGSRLCEWEFNRDIVRRIAMQLANLGIRYAEVMPDSDRFGNDLAERVYRANRMAAASEMPALFVSVHANAAPTPAPGQWCDPEISGIETWYFVGSDAGKYMAAVFQRHLVANTGWRNRHIKGSERLYVLRRTTMPAILTENGFYNQNSQGSEMMRDEVRQRIAEAHVLAILQIEATGLPGTA